jgi:hypothetical protein
MASSATLVVRAVPNGVTVHAEPNAVVILVRAEQHILVAQLGICAAHDADHVHRRRVETFDAQVNLHAVPVLTIRTERGTVHEEHRRAVEPRCGRRGCRHRIARHTADHIVRAALLNLPHAVVGDIGR